MGADAGSDPVPALVFDLLEWIGTEARPYAEVMDAWRTSCPRLQVWEEADANGYVVRKWEEEVLMVRLTEAGRERLARGRG
ncbi:MAG: hypothetical protein IPN16_20655 [Gemmatimonadetes bacterium]|nr:hypothetical protein [Gemmatimonadota bacterium]